jgi:ABC-type transporter Mla subunit MlaD
MPSPPIDPQLALAQLHALDLEAETDDQLRLLRRLREQLELKHATAAGAFSVAREQFEAAAQAADTLATTMRRHRERLADLRDTLLVLRETLDRGEAGVDPHDGDVVISKSVSDQSTIYRLSTVSGTWQMSCATYDEALRRVDDFATDDHVDVWYTEDEQSFRRVRQHRTRSVSG